MYLCLCVCVVEYNERCTFLTVFVCVYIYIFIYYPLHLKHSILLRCFHALLCITLLLCMYVCLCLYLYVCPFRAGLFCAYWIRVSVFFQYSTNSCWYPPSVFCLCVSFNFHRALKSPFVMISLVVSVVVAILWECSHILMKDCSSQSQPAVVVIVSPMST